MKQDCPSPTTFAEQREKQGEQTQSESSEQQRVQSDQWIAIGAPKPAQQREEQPN